MPTRPPVFTWSEDLHFGPPSEPVHIQKFIDEAEQLSRRGLSPWLDVGTQSTSGNDAYDAITGWKDWKELSDQARVSVEADCKLDDIKSPPNAVLRSQGQASYLQRTHAAALGDITAPETKKGKDKKPANETGLEPLKRAIEETPLKMWRSPYIRTGHVSDQNALLTPQLKHRGATPTLTHEVLITLTAYTKNTWYPYGFVRTCQHVLSSGCTLTDLWGCISCDLRGDGRMPHEVFEYADDDMLYDGAQRKARVVGYEFGDGESDHDSAVIVIEGTAYCDGRGSPNYVDKLLSHLETFKPPPLDSAASHPLPLGPYERPKRSTPLQKGPPFHAVPLRSLTLRVNEPYWIMHRGGCEHWFVVDQIRNPSSSYRLQNPRDPSSGYPIATQRTPSSHALCRICSRVPATVSIINDVRLGESPALLCQPCWKLFGEPPPPRQDDELNARVVVVPMLVEKL
ncbi:snRNA-activating protein of 50kDa MW C terminal-domain-containing protein [Gautieria morchelliformis]|nr:snRNA-activating protein of 50kDa MW C terminal-domain-containing protein [Gautieria morchelliformis]